jgi:DNA-binding NarL/FixJ family response regulator
VEWQVEIPDSTKQLARAAIRLLIVDDHEIVSKGLCSVLDEDKAFEVVGLTGSGNLAVTLAM